MVRGQDGAAAEALKAEVGKLQGLKADLAEATAAAEAESTFDRKGNVCCRCCWLWWWCCLLLLLLLLLLLFLVVFGCCCFRYVKVSYFLLKLSTGNFGAGKSNGAGTMRNRRRFRMMSSMFRRSFVGAATFTGKHNLLRDGYVGVVQMRAVSTGSNVAGGGDALAHRILCT